MKSILQPLHIAATALIIFACHSISSHAQVASLYTFSTDTVGLATAPLLLPTQGATMTGGTILASGGPGSGTYDHLYPSVPIGFSFGFNNNTYTTIGISSNGFAWFGNGSPSATEYNPISDNFVADGVVSVLGGSLTGRNYIPRTGAGPLITPEATIEYQTLGSAPYRTFIVSWNNFTGKSILDTAYNDTTQDYNNYRLDLFLVLYECSNIVQPMINGNQYPWFSAPIVTTLSGETGLRGSSPTDYYNCSAACQVNSGFLGLLGALDLAPTAPPTGSNTTQITLSSSTCIPGTIIGVLDLTSPLQFDIVGGNPQAWNYNPNDGCFGIYVQEIITTPISVFPNPTEGEFQISPPDQRAGDLKFQIERIEVYNVLGEKILEQQTSPSQEGNTKNINLTNHSPGIYLLKVYDENGNITTAKVVKQ